MLRSPRFACSKYLPVCTYSNNRGARQSATAVSTYIVLILYTIVLPFILSEEILESLVIWLVYREERIRVRTKHLLSRHRTRLWLRPIFLKCTNHMVRLAVGLRNIQ